MYTSKSVLRGSKFGATPAGRLVPGQRAVVSHASKSEPASSISPEEVQMLVEQNCNVQQSHAMTIDLGLGEVSPAFAGGVPAGRPVIAGLNIKLESEMEDVDSMGYMNDMLNLSVDLDDDEDETSIDSSEVIITDNVPGARYVKAQEANVSPVRLAARKLVATHNPTEVTAGEKHHWMVVTVPETPVAGEDLVLYFNKNQSDALREKPCTMLQYGFNGWELKPQSADKVALVPSAITREEGADFWTCTIKVPKESYELNFIFSDGEFEYENNANQDFRVSVAGGPSFDDWLDLKAEKTAAAEIAKGKAVEVAAAAAERERQAKAIEEDKKLGRNRANDLKNRYQSLYESGKTVFQASSNEPVRWKTEPAAPVAGAKFKIFYNLRASCLSFLNLEGDQAPTLLYGFNGWTQNGNVIMKKVLPAPAFAKAAGAGAVAAPRESDGGEWYMAEIMTPTEAVVMNMVFNFFEHYDNNDGNDYAVRFELPKGDSLATWSDGLAEAFRVQVFKARISAEKARFAKEAAHNEAKKKAKENVMIVERRKVRHVLYTEPEVLTAGEDMTVFYNPQDTVLNGRQEVYLIAGFNRWEHPRKFGPLKMSPPGPGGKHFETTIKIPLDAYKVDMVFADVAGGEGTYDNRGGLDYNLPVENSPTKEAPMHVVHISVEMAPIAKVGGLGDVVTALGRAVQDAGHLVEVILPRYDFFLGSPMLNNGQMSYETEFDWGGTRIYVSTAIIEGLRVFFIEPRNGYFATSAPYGRSDDELRFDFFCKAALEFLLRTGRQPDILHCHDWSTASVAKDFWENYQPFGLWKPKVVFTIHNLNYGQKKLAEAAYFSQKFTTVSPTYAYETGGNPIIAPHGGKFMGIRNGIDMDLWDPENNKFLPISFNSNNVVEGKAACKKALRQRLGLTDWGDKFVVGVVSRLTGQKGVHLIKHTAFRTLERGGQFVLLGSAPDPKVQAEFDQLAGSCDQQNAAFCFKYDEPLSHLIYAACDMICVPSMFEPCGLTQMIAMRFGSIPVVRHTGGLKDTVFDVDFDKARAAWDLYGSSDGERDQVDGTNGFAFDGSDPGALDSALNRAIDAWYNDRQWFQGLQKRVMEQDWSWNRPALDYVELYHGAKKS